MADTIRGKASRGRSGSNSSQAAIRRLIDRINLWIFKGSGQGNKALFAVVTFRGSDRRYYVTLSPTFQLNADVQKVADEAESKSLVGFYINMLRAMGYQVPESIPVDMSEGGKATTELGRAMIEMNTPEWQAKQLALPLTPEDLERIERLSRRPTPKNLAAASPSSWSRTTSTKSS